MLICGGCGATVKSLSDLAIHLKCEEKPLPLEEVKNTTNSKSMPCCKICGLVLETVYMCPDENCYSHVGE